MARFDLHASPLGRGFLLEVQSDHLDHLDTRVVVPLLPSAIVPRPMRELHPVFQVADQPHVMATQLLAALPRRELGRPVASLAAERDAITRALDLLLTGF